MKIKKVLPLTLLTLLLSCFAVIAQNEPQQHRKTAFDPEQMKVKKVNFIINRLSLSDAEIAKFKPVYEAMEEERIALFKEQKEVLNQVKEKEETLTEKDFATINAKLVEGKIKGAQLEQKYYDKLVKILNPRQLFNLSKAQQEFKREMVKDFKGHKGERRGEKRTSPKQ